MFDEGSQITNVFRMVRTLSRRICVIGLSPNAILPRQGRPCGAELPEEFVIYGATASSLKEGRRCFLAEGQELSPEDPLCVRGVPINRHQSVTYPPGPAPRRIWCR